MKIQFVQHTCCNKYGGVFPCPKAIPSRRICFHIFATLVDPTEGDWGIHVKFTSLLQWTAVESVPWTSLKKIVSGELVLRVVRCHISTGNVLESIVVPDPTPRSPSLLSSEKLSPKRPRTLQARVPAADARAYHFDRRRALDPGIKDTITLICF